MITRPSVSLAQQKIYRITKPLSRIAFFVKRNFSSSKIYTVEELFKMGGIELSRIKGLEHYLPLKVSQIAQGGSRMSPNCVVVQFNEDSDDVVRWSMQNGGIVAITRKQIDDLPCIVVEDPEQTYTQICKYIRNNSPVEITVVAGSIGKTTTKRMVNCVYASYYKTFNDPENENQLPCIGYAVQHIPPKTQQQVQEISEDTPGCLKKMVEILSPKIAIITTIDKSHIEVFGSEQAVYEEVATVLRTMPKHCTAIINHDDKQIVEYADDCQYKTISIGDSVADYYAKNINVDNRGLHFTIVEKETEREYPVLLKNIYAQHNIYSALYAFAAGVIQGIPHEVCVEGLQKYKAVGIRQNVYRSLDNKHIIYADCYNAVAKSVKSAIETAAQIPITGTRYAVLGDIEEAGTFSESTHLDIIKCIDSSNFDVLITYGDKLCKALSLTHLNDKIKVFTCNNKTEIVNLLKQDLTTGDLVLFKASRKSALESIIKGVWPFSYRLQMVSYFWAIIKWRLTIIFN